MAIPADAQVTFTLVDFRLRQSTGYAQGPVQVIVIAGGPALTVVVAVLNPVQAYLL
jgi:hypothetical protein